MDLGDRRCFCGGHGAWCGGGGWSEPENVLLSVHANEFCVFCFQKLFFFQVSKYDFQ